MSDSSLTRPGNERMVGVGQEIWTGEMRPTYVPALICSIHLLLKVKTSRSRELHVAHVRCSWREYYACDFRDDTDIHQVAYR